MSNVATVANVIALCEAHGLQVEEQSSFYKVSKDRKAVYISKSKRGVGRIDLAGFSVEHPAVTSITAEQAKEQRLGKVRGQIFPTKTTENWEEAFSLALDALNDGSQGDKFVRGQKDSEQETEVVAADIG